MTIQKAKVLTIIAGIISFIPILGLVVYIIALIFKKYLKEKTNLIFMSQKNQIIGIVYQMITSAGLIWILLSIF